MSLSGGAHVAAGSCWCQKICGIRSCEELRFVMRGYDGDLSGRRTLAFHLQQVSLKRRGSVDSVYRITPILFGRS